MPPYAYSKKKGVKTQRTYKEKRLRFLPYSSIEKDGFFLIFTSNVVEKVT